MTDIQFPPGVVVVGNEGQRDSLPDLDPGIVVYTIATDALEVYRGAGAWKPFEVTP
jgi:hypothetical protein